MAERIFREERSPAIPQRPQEVACCLGGLNMAQGLTHSLESCYVKTNILLKIWFCKRFYIIMGQN